MKVPRSVRTAGLKKWREALKLDEPYEMSSWWLSRGIAQCSFCDYFGIESPDCRGCPLSDPANLRIGDHVCSAHWKALLNSHKDLITRPFQPNYIAFAAIFKVEAQAMYDQIKAVKIYK
jgi:hypothetical protein